MEPFYYQHLTKSEQTVYHAIKTGVTALEDHFLVPSVSAKAVAENQMPQIFWWVLKNKIVI